MRSKFTLPFRPFAGLYHRYRSVVARLDTTFLKRAAVVTYFGVYGAIAFGRRPLNRAVNDLPALLRPPSFDPIHVALGLPRSVAWALVSVMVMLVVVLALILVSLHRDRRDPEDDVERLGEPPQRTGVGRWTPAPLVALSRAVTGRSSDRARDTPPSTDGGEAVAQETSTDDASTTVLVDTTEDSNADVSEDTSEHDDPADQSDGSDAAVAAPTDPIPPVRTGLSQGQTYPFDGVEILTADGAEGNVQVDESPDEAVDVDPTANASGDSPDSVTPWPSETTEVSDDQESPSADAEWPGDWMSGDDV